MSIEPGCIRCFFNVVDRNNGEGLVTAAGKNEPGIQSALKAEHRVLSCRLLD